MRNLLISLLLLPVAAFADAQMAGMESSSHASAASAAQHDYQTGMDKMHAGMMSAVKSKNPDVAFAQGMRAHHQGAIDMAKTELKYGKDAEMRQLAQDIIAAQQKEIAQMDRWLEAHSDTAD